MWINEYYDKKMVVCKFILFLPILPCQFLKTYIFSYQYCNMYFFYLFFFFFFGNIKGLFGKSI